jgi:hypothetical protein
MLIPFLDIRQVVTTDFRMGPVFRPQMRYDNRMIDTQHRSRHLSMAALWLAGLLVSFLVFFGWMRFGSEIFLSLIDSGLAYCL